MKLPVNPAHKGSKIVPRDGTAMNDASFCRLLIGVMVMRNGGEPVSFTQADFDTLAGFAVLEGNDAQGNFMVGVGRPKEAQA